IALPAEEEADQLPHGVQAQAPRHDRIAEEMAAEEPEVRLDVEFGLDIALAIVAAVLGNAGDAVEHQHRRSGQLRVARAEHFAAPAGQKGFVVEGRRTLAHILKAPLRPAWRPLTGR